MKLSQGLWQTLKEVPSDAETQGHQLLLRAGLALKMSAGLYSFLPLGLRSVKKVEALIRKELDRRGFLETLPPFVTPGELWKESGRWSTMGKELLRVKDRVDREICLSPTNEEAFVDIFRRSIKSYKQLPLTLYQINTKYRDEVRPRYGLLRCREFIMKDGYSFHQNQESLEEVYQSFYQAYEAILKGLGLDFLVVEADPGAMAESWAKTHEFQVLAESGEDQVFTCDHCDYRANSERASSMRKSEKSSDETMKSLPGLKEVATPGTQTMQEVCDLLKMSLEKGLKALVYSYLPLERSEDESESQKGEDSALSHALIFLLGDDKLNEIKLKAQLKARDIFPSTAPTLESLGLYKGFIGPHSLPQKMNEVKVLFDQAIDPKSPYVVGANKKDAHLENFVIERDLKGSQFADLREVQKGEICPSCKKGVLKELSGIEVGHIFQLGDKYTKSMKAQILDDKGKAFFPLMGCYGIGVTRIVQAAIEQNHDQEGIIWPLALAPYQVHFIVIAKDPEVLKLGEDLYQKMLENNLEVLYDDRDLGPGNKFKDADLLGLPLRVVLGERDFKKQGQLQVRERRTKKENQISPDDLISFLQESLNQLK